jgi:hypothetical protein
MTKKPRETKAILAAALEAQRAKCDALGLEVTSLRSRVRELEGELIDAKSMLDLHRAGVFNDAQRIKTNAEAMAIARERARAGTPCYARGLKVYDSRTHDVIAG